MPSLNFNPFPILTTERLILRQLTKDDANDIHALRSNAEVNRYLERAPAQSIDDALKFIAKIDDVVAKNEGIYWVITKQTDKTFVGTICLFGFREDKCEIGYELLPAFQGQGIMREAAEEVIKYAMEKCGFKIIEAYTHKDNTGSTKLLLRSGFVMQHEDKENPDYVMYKLLDKG